MNIEEFNKITKIWDQKGKSFNVIYRIGIIVEKTLHRSKLGILPNVIFCIYLFFYEFQKILDLLDLFFLKRSAIYSTASKVQKYLNYICLEWYIKNYIDLQLIKILCLVIIGIEIVISIIYFLIFLFTSYEEIEEKKVSYIKNYTIKFTNIILINFKYSFIYINLFIFTHFIENTKLSLFDWIIVIVNIFSIFLFSVLSAFHIYFYNDVSPLHNKLFISVSNPMINIIVFFKFYVYFLFLLVFNFFPKILLHTLIILYFVFLLYQLYNKVYIINYYYYFFFFSTNLFFFFIMAVFMVIEILRNALQKDYENSLLFYYIIIISIIMTFLSLIFLTEKRVYKFYGKKIEKKNDIDFERENVCMYFFLKKKRLGYKEIYKHKNLCKIYQIGQTECICKNISEKEILSLEVEKEIKSKTIYILSLILKKNNIFYLMYLNYILIAKIMNHSVISMLLSYRFENLTIFTGQFIIRTILKFINHYDEFYIKSQNITNVNSRIIGDILHYEFIFRKFMKNIINGFDRAREFWELCLGKIINLEKFFNKGMALGKLTIDISKDFGLMQNIYKNKVVLLKIYTSFINSVLNDTEYSELLISIVRENLQLKNNRSSFSTIFFEKEFGVIMVSGEIKTLFQIIKLNNYTKQLLSTSNKINLKSQDIHYFIPFPLNIFHFYFLKNKLDLSTINYEKIIFLIKENGELLFINSNIIPIISLNGTVNFIVLFYLNNEHKSRKVFKAISDCKGNIFGMTNQFKEEFKIDRLVDFYTNMKLYKSYNNSIDENNSYLRKEINCYFQENDDDKESLFPKVWEIFEETHHLFVNLGFNIRKSTFKRNTKYLKFVNKLNRMPSRKKKDFDMIEENSDNNCNEISEMLSPKRESVFQTEVPIFKQLRDESPNENFHLLSKKISSQTRFSQKSKPKLLKFKSTIKSEEDVKKKYNNLSSGKDVKVMFMDIIEKKISGEIYDLKIIKKDSLLGLFSYYLIEAKEHVKITQEELKEEQYIETHHKTESQTPISKNYLQYDNGSFVSSVISSIGSNNSNNYSLNAKFRLSNVLINYQNQNQTNYSNLPKIVKKIYYYFIFIFICLICLSLTQVIYQFIEVNSYQNSFKILEKFLNIRFNFLVIILNMRRLVNIRAGIEDNKYKFFSDKLFYLTSSLDEDVDELMKTTSELAVKDLSSYKKIYDLITKPNINLFFLKTGYVRTNQTYNIFTALNIYISQIHSLIISKNPINITEIIYSDIKKDPTREPTQNEVNLDFITFNFYQNFLFYLKDVSLAVIEDTNTILNKSNNQFIYLSITLGLIFLTIFTLLFFIVKNIYDIHQFIISNYRNLGSEFISSYLDNLLKIRDIIKNISNENEKLIILTKSITDKRKEFKKDRLKKKEIPEKSSKKDVINTYKSHNQLTDGNHSINENAQEKGEVINTETNFIETKFNKSKTKKKNSKSKSHIKNLRFYLNIFLLGILFFLSFSYTIIFQCISHPYLNEIIQNLYKFKYIANIKAEVDYMLINSYGFSIISNKTVQIYNQDMFSYYLEKFHDSQNQFNKLLESKYIFYKNLQEKIKVYYSNKFCQYFYQTYPNLYNLNTTQQICEDTELEKGILSYLFDLKNKLNNYYLDFIILKNKTIKEVVKFIQFDNYIFYALTAGFYLRGFFKDIMNSFNSIFVQLCDYINFLYFFFFSFFLLHFIISVYYIISKFSIKIYFYFEKLRILISILPNSLLNSKEMRKFLNRLY